jgi:hypothetical protein
MNITNTMCRLNQLSKKQIDSLIEAMPKDDLFDFGQGEGLIGFSSVGRSGTWVWNSGDSLISYTEMMQLLGKTMEFTKSDLKTGMFVKQRNGDFKIVLDNATFSYDYFLELSSYGEKLTNRNNQKEFDITAVYKTNKSTSLTKYLEGQGLTIIWERTEQTPAQKEMEELQSQISKLQEQAKVLQSKL